MGKRDEMIQKGEVIRDPALHAAEAARAAQQSTSRSTTALSRDISNSSSGSINSNNSTGNSREKRLHPYDTQPRPMNFVLTPYGERTSSMQLALPYISVLSNTKVQSLKSYLHLKFP